MHSNQLPYAEDSTGHLYLRRTFLSLVGAAQRS
jgi:hypothetical protein